MDYDPIIVLITIYNCKPWLVHNGMEEKGSGGLLVKWGWEPLVYRFFRLFESTLFLTLIYNLIEKVKRKSVTKIFLVVLFIK